MICGILQDRFPPVDHLARGQMAETLTWAQKLIDPKITFILFPPGVAQTLGRDTRTGHHIFNDRLFS